MGETGEKAVLCMLEAVRSHFLHATSTPATLKEMVLDFTLQAAWSHSLPARSTLTLAATQTAGTITTTSTVAVFTSLPVRSHSMIVTSTLTALADLVPTFMLQGVPKRALQAVHCLALQARSTIA